MKALFVKYRTVVFQRLLPSLLLLFLAEGAFSGVQAATNVTLTKSADNPTPKVLDTYRYYLTVGNTGATTATGVVVTDSVPPGLSISNISNGGTLSGGTITWNLPNLSCASQTVTLTPDVDLGGGWGNFSQVQAVDGTYAVADLTPSNVKSDSNIFYLGPFLGYQVNSVLSVVIYFRGHRDNTADTITGQLFNTGSFATPVTTTTLPLTGTDATYAWDVTSAVGGWNQNAIQNLAVGLVATQGSGGSAHTEYMDAVWAVVTFQSCGTQVYF